MSTVQNPELSTGMFNQLEPDSLIAQFALHPPNDFDVFCTPDGAPAFLADFDLLTTADARLRRLIARLPLSGYWSRLLRPRTCFIGTTVSEYALLPRAPAPDALVASLMRQYARAHPWLIVKDIPQRSPLLDADANAFADALAHACQGAGWVLLQGQALAYVPVDFASTDEYLARLSSGRRRDIRRKLRARSELQVEALPTGDPGFADAALLEEFYALYLAVYAQSEIHFDRLSPEFFRAMLRDGDSGGVVFVYRHDGRMIGYNICFVAHGNLLDKYVGFRYPQARQYNLYFVSWMHNLDYACAHGLRHYIAGWTDPEIKAYLGASFTFTRHAVHVRNPLLRAVVRRIAGRFESDRQWQSGNPIQFAPDAAPLHEIGTHAIGNRS